MSKSVFRWDHCVVNREQDVERFVQEYLSAKDRRVCLIAGAGFDPRSTTFADLLAKHKVRTDSLLFREERPSASKKLRAAADQNLQMLKGAIPNPRVEPLSIFNEHNLLIGGKKAVEIVSQLNLAEYSDLVLDCSALSRGVVFPIARFLLESDTKANVHVIAVDEPGTDDEIVPVMSERASYIVGFRGAARTGVGPEVALLWLPQLVLKQHRAFELIYDMIKPYDVCPILPFPCADPKLPDKLLEDYATELQLRWEVDARSIVYAHESDPIDLYRSILRLHFARDRIFRENRGSEIILSPLGSKLLSLGAMLAAIEHNFPVVYVEAVEYRLDLERLNKKRTATGPLVHLWLRGEPYENAQA